MTDRPIPLSLDPASISPFRAFDRMSGQVEPCDALDSIAGALAEAQATATRIEQAHVLIMRDASRTKAANHLRSRKHSLKLAGVAAAALDRAQKTADATLLELEQTSRPPPIEDESLASEIRERLAALKSPADRARAVASDPRVLAAAAAAPSFLSGASDEEVGLWLGSYALKHHPDLVARAPRIRKATEALNRAGNAFTQWVDTLTDSRQADLAAASAQAADDAIAEAA